MATTEGRRRLTRGLSETAESTQGEAEVAGDAGMRGESSGGSADAQV